MAAYQQPYGGPNPGRSGGDPRGRVQNQSGYQQQRYENQQGPFVNELARQFGRGSEADYQNYGNIMKRYGDIASGGGTPSGKVNWTDPFNSYGGFTEFSKTGGYSPTDIANMRARGVSPIRASYANAQRAIGQQRSLQGGYSPNAIATQAKMAREQGQSMADATQNVEAGLAEARNRGRLAGLSGMSDIEKQRLAAQLDAGKFNALQQNEQGMNQLRALQGMTSLYGTTPGMAAKFGDLLNASIGQGGQFGLGLMGRDIEGQQLPGQWDTTMNRVNDVSNMAYPWLDMWQKRQQQQGQTPMPYQVYGPEQPEAPWQGPPAPWQGSMQEPQGDVTANWYPTLGNTTFEPPIPTRQNNPYFPGRRY